MITVFASAFASAFVFVISLWVAVLGGIKVPAAAKDHFKTVHPNATAIHWSQEADKKYEVEFKEDKHEMSVTYSEKGDVLETEREITEAELPGTVLDAARKINPKAKMKEFAIITRANGTKVYEVELKQGKKSTDMLFTEDGVVTQ